MSKNNKICPTCGDEFSSTEGEKECEKCLIQKVNTSDKFELRINVPMIKELVSDKIYRSDASAFREQYVNALSHGCIAYHEKYGYTDEVYVKVVFDYGKREITITDNGMGMTREVFSNNFMSFGFSTVSKDNNNTRSGMWGLGAISFFRIASACIVESWDRETDDHFCYMTRNTDESEFLPKANWTLEKFGTVTRISLKEKVKMNQLVNKVKQIASNYPVKTILEVINAEQEQNISSYSQEDEDAYIEYNPVMRFKDYVDTLTNGKFTTVIDNEELELYMSTTGGNNNSTYLCRVPIDISYSTGFTTFLNIKKEKIDGEDSKGNYKLKEVPKPDRDSVNEEAEEYFSAIIKKEISDIIYAIDITSYEDYKVSDKRWILSGYSVDDQLNRKTHTFIQKLREPVRYRNSNGIQKRQSTILELLGEYDNVFVHPSLHKGTYMALEDWHKKKEYKKQCDLNPEFIVNFPAVNKWSYQSGVCFIDNAKNLPIEEAKAFKKKHFIPAVHTTTSSGGVSVKGLLVRSGTWNNHRIASDDDEINNKIFPGGVYYGDGIMGQWNISNINLHALKDQKCFMTGIVNRSKSGIVVAKTGKKALPSIVEWQKRMIAYNNEGKIKRSTGEEIELKLDSPNNLLFPNLIGADRSQIILPLSCENYEFLKHMPAKRFLFIPAKEIYTTVLCCGGHFGSNDYRFMKVLGKIPKWSKMDQKILGSVLSKIQYMHKGYSNLKIEVYAEIANYILDLKMTKVQITEDKYTQFIEEILDSHHVSHYQVRYDFKDMFPERYLEEKAERLGFNDTEKVKGDDQKLIAYADNLANGELVPMKIGNVARSVFISQKDNWTGDGDESRNHSNNDLEAVDLYDWEAIIDDDGIPRMAQIKSRKPIVERNGKLKYMDEVSDWS